MASQNFIHQMLRYHFIMDTSVYNLKATDGATIFHLIDLKCNLMEGFDDIPAE